MLCPHVTALAARLGRSRREEHARTLALVPSRRVGNGHHHLTRCSGPGQCPFLRRPSSPELGPLVLDPLH